jgi:hypothetical protein
MAPEEGTTEASFSFKGQTAAFLRAIQQACLAPRGISQSGNVFQLGEWQTLPEHCSEVAASRIRAR